LDDQVAGVCKLIFTDSDVLDQEWNRASSPEELPLMDLKGALYQSPPTTGLGVQPQVLKA
jgi:hypothetical protein